MTELISTREAAAIAGVAASTLRAYAARGHCPPQTVPGWWDRDVFAAWVAARPGQGARTDLAGSAVHSGRRTTLTAGTCLGDHLACYGLLHLLGRVGIDDAAVWWDVPGSSYVSLWVDGLGDDMRAAAADLSARWEPLPIMTPWNNGSGLVPGAAAPGAAGDLAAIRAHTDPRAQVFASAVAETLALTVGWGRGGVVRGGKIIDKPAALQGFWSAVPVARPWVAACWAARDDGDPTPNPLSGSGGNAGRLDYGALYARCVLELLADTGRAVGWLADLLGAWTSSPTPLLRATPGRLLDERGAENGLLNPWSLVLALEGLWASTDLDRVSPDGGFPRRPDMVVDDRAASTWTWPWVLPPADYADTVPVPQAWADAWLPTWATPLTWHDGLQVLRDPWLSVDPGRGWKSPPFPRRHGACEPGSVERYQVGVEARQPTSRWMDRTVVTYDGGDAAADADLVLRDAIADRDRLASLLREADERVAHLQAAGTTKAARPEL